MVPGDGGRVDELDVEVESAGAWAELTPHRKVRRSVVVVATGIVGAFAFLGVESGETVSFWWVFTAAMALCLGAFVRWDGRYDDLPMAEGRVLAIVPAYNEDPALLEACVRGLAAQTVPVDVVVIDDGSAVPVVPFDCDGVRWMAQPNRGKARAQATVLRDVADVDYRFVLTVDSDSVPRPDACERLLRALSDPEVQAATGWIHVRNYRDNLIARAADLDIGGMCVMMRASRSWLGALETTSGALALYRAELFYDHLDAYEIGWGVGDDRWMTLRALRRGRVVGVNEAVVETDMPTTVRGMYRQRRRWAQSWWRMIPYVFRWLSPRQLISPAFGLLQLLVAPVVWGTLAARLVFGDHLGSVVTWRFAVLWLAVFVAQYVGLAWLYLASRDDMGWRQKAVGLTAGTLVNCLVNVFVLTPARYAALRHLTGRRWATRTAPVVPQVAG